MAPANPRTLDELVIPAEYKTTIDGKPFLLYDSNDEKSGKPRILIYSIEENLNLMTNCNNWYADGTFSSAPSIFYQLYTIHGIQYSNVLPFLFTKLEAVQSTTLRQITGLDWYVSNDTIRASLKIPSLKDHLS
ncbi:unnamed protein product [Macrosiphum euphorbiae]|uniref:Uncharacterized protein n=1 Tax=Macrosiphum euphorbiae TaxID=13131 RepID=A0AAV0VGG9_9HEMI|nr:unnamed protein product [Macrosiphum euphorbiae]